MSTWMKHPKLPEDQIIQVLDEAVESNRRAGWEVTDAPPEPTGAEIEAALVAETDEATKSGSKSGTDIAAVDERPKKTNTAKDGKE